MFRRPAFIAALSLVAAIANTQPQNYAQRGTQIRAGIALIESSQTLGQPNNTTPFVWYNLDSNRNVKPAGWNIFNPNAPGQATSEIANRWAILGGGVGPVVTERITKRNAAYWEFRLSQATDTQMAQYDVLMVNAAGNVSLNSAEREKLRQFVDRGGVLWVEVGSINNVDFNTLYTTNGFPLPFAVGNGGGGFGNLDVFHPVLSYPYTFNITDLDYLNNGGAGFVLNQASPAGAAGSLSPSTTWDWSRLKSVVEQGNLPTMMVGRIGDGFMVVTARGAANYLNRLRTGINNGYYAGDPRGNLDRGSDVVGKLAINVISLGSGSEQPGGGSRKSGSSPIDIGAPLLRRFRSNVIPQLDHGNKSPFPAAAYKGLVVVSANNQVLVYDANPSKDIDGDGNPDDGVQDYSLGEDFDLVWSSGALAGPISAPTCIEIEGNGGDQILVTLGDGTVAAFNAFTGAGLYTVPPPVAVPSVDTSVLNHGPYAPTYHEGLVYVATNPGTPNPTGQVWVLNPATGLPMNTAGTRWLVGDPTAPILQQISAAPTVGYIPIADNSGGHDKVVYVPTRPGTTLAGPNAGIYSIWAGVRGESPINATFSAGTLTVTTRASQRGLWVVNENSTRGVKLTVLRANGDPLSIAEMNSLFGGAVVQSSQGILDFPVIGAWLPEYTVRLDYTIDWGRGPAASQAAMRGNIFLPDDPNNRRTILGNIAMSGRGTIYVVHSTASDASGGEGGAFYAFREQGQGAFRCLARYDAYRQHTINLNQASPVAMPATVNDNDPLTTLNPGVSTFLNGVANRMTFMTGPVVRGDYVYAAASLWKTGPGLVGFVPNTVLFAFNAEPEAPEIQVGDLSEGFNLVQPDMVRSTNKNIPNQFNTAARGQYQYIRESGKIRFESLMTPNRGQINNCFSLSQPVILRSGGRPDTLVYPDANGGSRWSPLAWYTVLHGVSDATTPVVTGGTIFLGGASALPEILEGTFSFPPTTRGILWGANADISERDPFNYPDAGRPWNRQAVVLKGDGLGGIESNPNIRWPQNQGVTSFQVWATRVLQASMPGTGRTMSIAAGEGGLFATGGAVASSAAYGGPGSIFGFTRSDFLVADEGRLGRYDPAGNPIFATDMTNNSGSDVSIGGATSVRAIQRPNRAYPVGNDMVVVDPPTNRVIRLDGFGRELRSIEAFRLDPASGISLAANEPLTLNNPRDVTVFTEYIANPTGVSNPRPLEFWVHYVIADAGNRRIIDIVDRYEANPATRLVGDLVQVGTQRQLGILRWHSPAEYSGKRFEYNAISRAASVNNPNEYWYVAGIGNAMPTNIDTGLDSPAGAGARESRDGNGGIVIFNPFNPADNVVINEVTVPATGPGVFINQDTWEYDPTPRQAFVKKLGNLTSVTVRNVLQGGTPLWAIMFTDSTGVYEVVRPGGPGAQWVVRWMMPTEVYRVLRTTLPAGPTAGVFSNANPRNLRANYARRLDSGEVLIVNGYVGTKRNYGPGGEAEFSGEVIQVDGDDFATDGSGFGFNRANLGFSFASVRFELNLLTETRKLYQPVFADRR